MSDKEPYFFTYNQIHATIADLSKQLKQKGVSPDLMVAIGTGGFIPSRMLKTFMNVPVLTVGISYYDINNKPMESPHKIQWIDEVEKKLKGKNVLLVDEVDDTRVTLEYCLNELLTCKPKSLAIMVLHNKQKEKKGKIPPGVSDYFKGIDLEDRWIYYPWDAVDIQEHDSKAVSAT